MIRQHQRGETRHVCRRHRGAVRGRVATAGNRRHDRHCGRGNPHLRTRGAEARREDPVSADRLRDHAENVRAVGGKFPELADRGDRHHRGQRRRECEWAAGVARCRDARDAFAPRLLQLLAHQLGESVTHDADVDEIELAFDAFIQRRQQVADAALRNDLEHVQLGLGRAAADALLGARCVDDAGAVRPVRHEVVGPACICAARGEVLAARDVPQQRM